MKNTWVNPNMITIARNARGYSQKELVEKINGLTQSMLSKMEKGALGVSDETLNAISNELDYPIDFFREPKQSIPASFFHYRKKITIPKKVVNSLESQMDILRNAIDNLISSVELEPKYEIPSILVKDYGTPEDIARRVRILFKYPSDPIPNIFKVIEDSGSFIFRFDFGTDKIDGFHMTTNARNILFFVNSRHPISRQVFTLTHELGHVIMHLEDIITNDRDTENEANRFAAEFLMPEDEIANELWKISFQKAFELKQIWKVSMQAIIHRAFHLDRITYNTHRYLQTQINKYRWRKNEPYEFKLEAPNLLKQIIRLYKEELDYSLQDIYNIVKLSENDFNRYFLDKKPEARPMLKIVR